MKSIETEIIEGASFQRPNSWPPLGARKVLIVSQKLLNELSDVIQQQYKCLDRPDFSFVEKTLLSKPYAKVVAHLERLYSVEDVTDINDDVSFRYSISGFGNQWIVELSMLARYAALFRINSSGLEVVAATGHRSGEAEIISLLTKHHFNILSKDEMAHPLGIKLQNTEPENSCIYQALFSDTDVLPWES